MSEDKTPYDAGDEELVKTRKTKTRLKEEKSIEDWRAVLSTPAGQSVIWQILSLCRLKDSSFTGNSTTFFYEGHRNVGIHIIKVLDAVDESIYPKMQLDAISKKDKE